MIQARLKEKKVREDAYWKLIGENTGRSWYHNVPISDPLGNASAPPEETETQRKRRLGGMQSQKKKEVEERHRIPPELAWLAFAELVDPACQTDRDR